MEVLSRIPAADPTISLSRRFGAVPRVQGLAYVRGRVTGSGRKISLKVCSAGRGSVKLNDRAETLGIVLVALTLRNLDVCPTFENSSGEQESVARGCDAALAAARGLT